MIKEQAGSSTAICTGKADTEASKPHEPFSTAELREYLKKNPFVLAPMAGITDSPFRTFMKEMGAGIVVSELISAHGLKYANQRTQRLAQYDSVQRPIGLQLFGESPESVAEAAQYCESLGCDFIDLNFGCPVPKVVKKGAGSALLKDLKALEDMVSTVKKSIQIPLSIKIRTGWDANTLNANEVVEIAAHHDVAWVAIHGRTRAQAYEGLANWEYIQKVKETARIPIIGNGDILTPKGAVDRLRSSQCDAVMIGRGCLKNPWIFWQAQQLYCESFAVPTLLKERKSYQELLLRLFQLLEGYCDQKVLPIQIKKFASWFSTGYPGSSAFRKSLFQCQSIESLTELVTQFFSALDQQIQAVDPSERFLMGGHG